MFLKGSPAENSWVTSTANQIALIQLEYEWRVINNKYTYC